MKNLLPLSLLLLSLLMACDALIGEEVARLPVSGISGKGKVIMQESVLELEAGEKITFWADMDMDFDTLPELLFRLEIQQNNVPIGIQLLDPTKVSVKVNEVRTAIGKSVSWRFTGRMDDMKIDKPGVYKFRVMLVGNPPPAFVLNKAELVIRK